MFSEQKNVVTKYDAAAHKSDSTAINTIFFLIILVMSLNVISIKLLLFSAFVRIWQDNATVDTKVL